MIKDKPKLLAPAGSWPCLRVAVKAGADAVYFGVGQYNMRAAGAKNFLKKDFKEVINFCHKNDVEAYAAINTILYNKELSQMEHLIDVLKDANVDAIIAADMATIVYAKKKNISVHVSTQLSISNIEALKFYSNFADRVILARELSLNQVREIKKEIIKKNIKGPCGKLIELELFIHGALCVAVSGRCGMSLYHYGKQYSANRGRCLQMCRRGYKIIDLETDKEFLIDNNYIMSPSDLCTIGMLPDLIQAGADILKIEGRARPPEYVETVVGCYRQALDSIVSGNYTKQKIIKWQKQLRLVFNRGFQQGFYRGRTFQEWAGIEGTKSKKRKLFIGLVTKYYPKAKIFESIVKTSNQIKENDEIFIIGDKTGLVKFEVKEVWLHKKNKSNKVKKVEKGDLFTIRIKEKVRKGDQVYVIKN